jgi:predicted methyltransferase
MSSRRLASIAFASVFALAAACAEEKAPKTPADFPAPPPPVQAAIVEAAAPAPAPVEPTAEEKKKAEDAKKLAEDRAKWEVDRQAEIARWTPEMHTAATALAGKTYGSGKAAIQAAVAGTHRKPGNAARDKYRHPVETLDFLGLKPTMTVVDVGPGEGWYTELLAPALAKQGKLIVTTNDPNGPAESRGTFNGQRYKAFLDTSPELYGKVQAVVIDGKAPQLGLDKSADMILLIREVHGMVNSKTFALWLTEAHKALKDGGVLGIVEHRAKPDTDPVETSKKGYVPEKWVIDTVSAAGFKLVGKSEVNANPKDTKDYPEGVWSLPPSFQEKDVNRDKYTAIGESDRMTLKFVKAAPGK